MKPSFSGCSPKLIQLGTFFKSLLVSRRKRVTECTGIKIIWGTLATTRRALRLPRGKMTRRKSVRNCNYLNAKLSKVTVGVWRWGERWAYLQFWRVSSDCKNTEGNWSSAVVCSVHPGETWGSKKKRKEAFTLSNVTDIMETPRLHTQPRALQSVDECWRSAEETPGLEPIHPTKEPRPWGVESICPTMCPHGGKRNIVVQDTVHLLLPVAAVASMSATSAPTSPRTSSGQISPALTRKPLQGLSFLHKLSSAGAPTLITLSFFCRMYSAGMIYGAVFALLVDV